MKISGWTPSVFTLHFNDEISFLAEPSLSLAHVTINKVSSMQLRKHILGGSLCLCKLH